MTDEPVEPPNVQGINSPLGAEVLPIHMIPDELLQRWIALPSDQTITVNITKQDLDNLFFSISNAHMSLDATNRSFVQWSNRQVIEAQTGLEVSRQGVVAGLSSLRYFFEAVISRALERPENG